MKSLLLVLVLAAVGCTSKKATKEDIELLKQAQGQFQSLPETLIDKEKNADKIELGKKLYFEKKLSINDTISCNSCHNLKTFGVDNEKTSPGHDGTRGGRNSPTSLNAAMHFRQFWDGRAADVEEQALGPILNPIEHGLPNAKAAMKKINTDEYQAMFKKAGLDFTYKNVGVAIGAFERTLITPSRFDDFLKGDVFALNDQERKGLKKYMEIGCTSCHGGAPMGGTSYQKLGVVKKYPTKDTGRHEVTKKRRDKFKFKVPGLRNVAKTAPYLHDGSIATLDEAIDMMAEYQLGKKLVREDIENIKAFLSSTTAKEVNY
jgi:cytochrome c peroxidase